MDRFRKWDAAYRAALNKLDEAEKEINHYEYKFKNLEKKVPKYTKMIVDEIKAQISKLPAASAEETIVARMWVESVGSVVEVEYTLASDRDSDYESDSDFETESKLELVIQVTRLKDLAKDDVKTAVVVARHDLVPSNNLEDEAEDWVRTEIYESGVGPY